jgi:hypothetical protein
VSGVNCEVAARLQAAAISAAVVQGDARAGGLEIPQASEKPAAPPTGCARPLPAAPGGGADRGGDLALPTLLRRLVECLIDDDGGGRSPTSTRPRTLSGSQRPKTGTDAVASVNDV